MKTKQVALGLGWGSVASAQAYGGGRRGWSHLAAALVAATVAAALTPAAAATTPPQYTLTVLGTLGYSGSSATAISENGLVVGNGLNAVDAPGGPLFVAQTPLLYAQGALSALPVVAGLDAAYARGVNDSGVVVGAAYNLVDTGSGPFPSSATYRATSTQAGVVTDLGGSRSLAMAINQAGQAVGASRFGGIYHATMYAGGQVIDLGGLPGALSGGANAVNDLGEAVGYSTLSIDGYAVDFAMLFRQGQVVDLAVSPGHSSRAMGINNAGQVVGWMETADGSRTTSFLYTNGQVTDLGTLGGLNYSLAYDINNAGWVVGMAVYDDRPENIPFLRVDGELIDLNTLITPDSRGDWLMSDALAINDKGQIVGAVIRDGVRVAALLTPVPEAPTTAMLAAGLLAIGRRLRHRGARS